MDYLRADCWFIREAAILVHGGTPIDDGGIVSALDLPPLRPGQPDRINDLCAEAYRALDAGTLPYVGKRKDGQVRPADFLRWAHGKGYAIPETLRAAFMAEQCDPSPPEPGRPTSPIMDGLMGQGPIPRRERLTAILKALQAIDPGLNTGAMPGTKEDLLKLCQAVDTQPKQFSIALRTFDNCIAGWLQFEHGRNPGETTYYRDCIETVKSKLA